MKSTRRRSVIGSVMLLMLAGGDLSLDFLRKDVLDSEGVTHLMFGTLGGIAFLGLVLLVLVWRWRMGRRWVALAVFVFLLSTVGYFLTGVSIGRGLEDKNFAGSTAKVPVPIGR